MKIESVMTACPYKINAALTATQALDEMALYNIRHLPVVQDGEVLGVVSERDLTLSQIVCESLNFCPTVGTLCATLPLIVEIDEEIGAVARKMADQKFDCALVCKNNELVGIFTTVDACRILERTFPVS